jgi:adenylate kinase family enzyme
MERVVILGAGGAGKTELATHLGARMGIPVVHLDVLFWRGGWTPAPAEQARRDLAAAVDGERWILDGNFLDAGPGDARFARADTVIFLDLGRLRCTWRVLRRRVRGRGRPRPDLPAGCAEGFDLELLRWIWRYPRADRPRVLRLLDGLAADVRVHRLTTPADVRAFVRSV